MANEFDTGFSAISAFAADPEKAIDGVLTAGIKYVNRSGIEQALGDTARAINGLGAENLPQLTDEFLTALKTNDIDMNPVSNILNRYANYTYHIRWSMTNDFLASSLEDPTDYLNDQLYGKEIIAESGVTAGFNIIDFEITNLCAPGPRVQSMPATSFTMTVKEPYGFSLLDRIYSFSQNVGIKNHLTAPYFIEIWFTGYNEDGTIANIKQEAWRLFRIIITKVSSDVTEAGTTYKIEGTADGSYGNSDHVAVIGNGVKVEGAKTVGDFFNKLAIILNDQQKQLSYDATSRVFYSFEGLTTVKIGNTPMRDWQFTKAPSSDARSSNSDIKAEGMQNITISRGMDISTILYFVVSMTDEGRQFVAGQATGSTAAAGSANIRSNGLGHVIIIHTKVQIIGFDYLTNDYIRQVTYTFRPYVTNRALIDRNNVSSTLQPDHQLSRAKAQLNTHRYRKFYNFLFTGKNTDIIRFDIKLENYWQATLPSQLGENTYSNYTQGRAVGKGTIDAATLNRYRQAMATNIQAKAEFKSNSERPDAAKGNEATLFTAKQQSLRETIDRTNAQLAQFNATGGSTQFQRYFINQSTGNQAVMGALEGKTSLSSLTGSSILTSGLTAVTTLANMSNSLRGLHYLETQVIIDPTNQSPLPISFKQETTPINQTTTPGGAESKAPANTGQTPANIPRTGGLISAILNDLTTSPFFTTIELEIRGDPFWIGLGNVAENSLTLLDARAGLIANKIDSTLGLSGTSSKVSMSSSSGTISAGKSSTVTSPTDPKVWTWDGETGFLLSFRTGEPPNEETGLVTFNKTSIVFFGLYGVTEIRSKFSNGIFTQILKGFKDPLQQDTSALLLTNQYAAAGISSTVAQLPTNSNNI